jgi:hypothetical protein
MSETSTAVIDLLHLVEIVMIVEADLHVIDRKLLTIVPDLLD